MTDHTIYLFKSQRLGFRNWLTTDIEPMSDINVDHEVMAFFPETQTPEQTIGFIARMRTQCSEKSYCYFAVDRLDNGEFIGFIGLSEKNFDADFNPCIDIGWRIKRNEWNKGFATEGARRCLEYGFKSLGIEKINCIAPKVNLKSEMIMKKIGMRKVKDFDHPLLKGNKRLETCVLYEIKNETKK